MHRHIRMIALRWWRDTPPLASGIVAIIAAMLALTGSALIDGIRWRIVQGTWHGGADKGDPWYELGTALGFWGFVLFGLNFVLATRWRWLDRACGGLDRAYQLHGLVGRWAVTALALHLAVLLVQAWPDAAVVRQYLVPGADASFTSGMLGLLLLIMLVAITLWWRLPYQRWLASHRWMGVAYVLGGAHAIIAQGDWYLWLLTGGGAAAWIDAGWLGPRRRARRGVVTAVVRHRGVTDLICTLERPLPATAGQFVWLQVPGGTAVPPHERHPFSLSAIDDPRHVRISARAVGEFWAVSVVSGHIRGQTNTMPLHVEILYNEYQSVAAFTVASLLALLALVTLVIKSVIEWQHEKDMKASANTPPERPLASTPDALV